jgi:PIN domain nuclease of toxin-antitoxin system
MTYLIDTHTFLWYIDGSDKISSTSKSIIKNTNNKIFVSIASIWEISIKHSNEKLMIRRDNIFDNLILDIKNSEIEILTIGFEHISTHNKLPHHHRDPFDRMLIAQAITEQINIISIDTIFD